MQQSLIKGLASLRLQDLFTEQIDVCGSLEFFQEFVNESYVDMVLEWQTTYGCYMQYNGTYNTIYPNIRYITRFFFLIRSLLFTFN